MVFTFFSVSSSESADEENRYNSFKIFHVPFPGCEFFININHSGKQGIKQYFDWSQKMVDKIFDIPDIEKFSDMNIKWDEYKTWDIITLTKNYLMLILKQAHVSFKVYIVLMETKFHYLFCRRANREFWFIVLAVGTELHFSFH